MHSHRQPGPGRPELDNGRSESTREDRGAPTGSYRQGLHGGEIFKAAARVGLNPSKILDFSSNTNVFAYELTERLFNETGYSFTSYPDAACTRLTSAIAGHEGTAESGVLCGNGAADLIWQVLRCFAPSSVLFLGPVFSEYVRACEALGIGYLIIETLPEDEFACTPEILSRLWESRAELCIVCNPNNPGAVTYANLPGILSAVRCPRILVDLSYREFIYGAADYDLNFQRRLGPLANQGSELLCLHSFTKFFCCPGIRLGYLSGEPKSIARLARQAPSWSVGQFAQDMGVHFLERLEDYRASLRPLRAAAVEFGFNLRRLPVFETDLVLEGPNFFCCGLAEAYKSKYARQSAYQPKTAESLAGMAAVGSAGELQGFLLHHGILIRDCDNIPGMPPGFVRIQVRTPEDNDKLLHALARI